MLKKIVNVFVGLALLAPQVVFAFSPPASGMMIQVQNIKASSYEQVFTEMKVLAEENEANKRKFGDLNNFSHCSCHLQMKVTVPVATSDGTAIAGGGLAAASIGGAAILGPATLLGLVFLPLFSQGSKEMWFGDNFYFFESQNRELFTKGSDVILYVDMQRETCDIGGSGLEQYNDVGFLVKSCNFKKKGACCCNLDVGEYDKKYYNCQYVVATPGTVNQICPGGGILPYDEATKCVDQTKKIKDRPKGESNVTLDINTLKQKTSALNFLGDATPQKMVQRAIDLLMAFMGTILFALYIYAGFTWMLANGNDEKITSAKNILVWSTLGVAVMLGSYVIIKFIFDTLT